MTEIILLILSLAILLLTWRISRMEKLLIRSDCQKSASKSEPIIVKPLIVRKLRTEEQKRQASEKRKEWWARKRAAGSISAALKD